MRDDLVHELLRHLQGAADWKLGRCPRQAESTLLALELPAPLTRLLIAGWVNERTAQVGGYLLHTASDIAANPWLLVLRTHRMLPIGRAPNQDVLVLRFDGLTAIEVGVVSRAFTYRSPGGLPPAPPYVRIAASLDDLFLRVADGLFVPGDYEAARQWRDLRRERTALLAS